MVGCKCGLQQLSIITVIHINIHKNMQKGDLVQVERRNFPGVPLKEGGVGRVKAIHEDGTFDVKYVLGGVEKRIPTEFVHPNKDLPKRKATPNPNTSTGVDENKIGSNVVISTSSQIKKKQKVSKPTPKAVKSLPIPSMLDLSKFKYRKGQTVNVTSRTGPGMNKPGGVARIQTLKLVDANPTYDVRYVLGGSEKGLEEHLISVIDCNNTGQREKKETQRFSIEARQRPMPSKQETTTKKSNSAAKTKSASKTNKNSPCITKAVESHPAPSILSLDAVVQVEDPREIERQGQFRQCVAKVFRDQDVDHMVLKMMKTMINEEQLKQSNDKFNDEEFQTRLNVLDKENRIMLQKSSSTKYDNMLVWMV